MNHHRATSSWAAAATLGLWPFFGAVQGPDAAVTGPRSDQILHHLTQAIGWYRLEGKGTAWVGQPGDRIYFINERNLSARIVQLAFEASGKDAAALPAAPAGKPSADQLALAKSRADAATRIAQARDKMAVIDAQLAAAPAGGRELLQAQRDELAAELDLATATQDSINKISSFISTNAGPGGTASLGDKIAELQMSVPEAFAQGEASKPPELHLIGAAGGGLVANAEVLYGLIRADQEIKALHDQTKALDDTVNGLRKPLGASLRGIIQQGSAATDQAAAADVVKLNDLRDSFADLAGKFRDLAGAAVPLRQEDLLLQQNLQNLGLWQASLEGQANVIIRELVLRALGLAVALAVLLGLSELWRYATFRYVHDVRRRRQFLLVRRITTGIVLALVVVSSFVSDYSSLATYAGFMTAGIALALQTVIVSVAAYFLLIGRYGVKIGDRLTVSGVTGQVIEIGLMRFYMMELAGAGANQHPTGRVAVFANSVFFQPTPLYRQLPGTDYTWHEASVPLANTADFTYITEKLLAAATAVYVKYRPELEKQHGETERLIDLKLDVPEPSAQVRFNPAGVELSIRYPVGTLHAGETDSLMASELLAAIRGDDKIKDATTGMPQIAAVKV
jgi:small-conductance mechanosensitive channel